MNKTLSSSLLTVKGLKELGPISVFRFSKFDFETDPESYVNGVVRVPYDQSSTIDPSVYDIVSGLGSNYKIVTTSAIAPHLSKTNEILKLQKDLNLLLGIDVVIGGTPYYTSVYSLNTYNLVGGIMVVDVIDPNYQFTQVLFNTTLFPVSLV